MRIVKTGTVTMDAEGNANINGFDFDCEGQPFNAAESLELVRDWLSGAINSAIERESFSVGDCCKFIDMSGREVSRETMTIACAAWPEDIVSEGMPPIEQPAGRPVRVDAFGNQRPRIDSVLIVGPGGVVAHGASRVPGVRWIDNYQSAPVVRNSDIADAAWFLFDVHDVMPDVLHHYRASNILRDARKVGFSPDSDRQTYSGRHVPWSFVEAAEAVVGATGPDDEFAAIERLGEALKGLK